MSILTKITPIVTNAWNSPSKICKVTMTNYNTVLSINLNNNNNKTLDQALYYANSIIKQYMDNYRIITISHPSYYTPKVFITSNGQSASNYYNACLEEIWHTYLNQNGLLGGTLPKSLYKGIKNN